MQRRNLLVLAVGMFFCSMCYKDVVGVSVTIPKLYRLSTQDIAQKKQRIAQTMWWHKSVRWAAVSVAVGVVGYGLYDFFFPQQNLSKDTPSLALTPEEIAQLRHVMQGESFLHKTWGVVTALPFGIASSLIQTACGEKLYHLLLHPMTLSWYVCEQRKLVMYFFDGERMVAQVPMLEEIACYVAACSDAKALTMHAQDKQTYFIVTGLNRLMRDLAYICAFMQYRYETIHDVRIAGEMRTTTDFFYEELDGFGAKCHELLVTDGMSLAERKDALSSMLVALQEMLTTYLVDRFDHLEQSLGE